MSLQNRLGSEGQEMDGRTVRVPWPPGPPVSENEEAQEPESKPNAEANPTGRVEPPVVASLPAVCLVERSLHGRVIGAGIRA